MTNHTCTKCHDLGEYSFDRQYAPTEFLEGKRSSDVWIVGLNPATEIGFNHSATKKDLEEYFVPGEHFYSYFRNFRNVSEIVYNGFGREFGTAHTDIVKCGSKRFPGGKIGAELVHRCSGYLHKQVIEHKPRLIICNGSPVSKYLKKQFQPNTEGNKSKTSYWTTVEDVDVCIVLSGFIGRIDNYARKRLGAEIELRLKESKIRRL